jgi:hypothetical protein
MLAQNRVHCPAELTCAFAMDDSDLENAALLAGGYVIMHQFLHIARLKGMQVQDAVDGELDGLVHSLKGYAILALRSNRMPGTGRWKAPRTGSLERLPYTSGKNCFLAGAF